MRVSTFHRSLVLTVIFVSPFAAVAKYPQERRTQKRVLSDVGAIREAEALLFSIGFWTGPIDGILDETSEYALTAFQRMTMRPVTGLVTTKGGFHLEVDLTRQILSLIGSNNKIKVILPISTGDEKVFTQGGWTRRAKTPRGTYLVYRKTEGWHQSALGPLYYPTYIVGGVAIHGSLSVPNRPATHGCIAIPLDVAREFSRMVPLQTVVRVYGKAPTN
jgi:L,D-transpeptidase-like protein/putative peptidoglycan binding protein